MRKALRLLGWVLAVICAVAILLFGWLRFTAVSASELPPLRNGDIVFQYSGSSQSLPILLASRSVYTHMGVIEIDGMGKASVIEAANPSRSTPLDDWIKRGVGDRITVKRVSGLSDADALKTIDAARKYEGLPYDIFFLDGKDMIYCSELVRLAFEEGPAIELGQIQKVKDLYLDYAPVRKLIESRWEKIPTLQRRCRGYI